MAGTAGDPSADYADYQGGGPETGNRERETQTAPPLSLAGRLSTLNCRRLPLIAVDRLRYNIDVPAASRYLALVGRAVWQGKKGRHSLTREEMVASLCISGMLTLRQRDHTASSIHD